MSSGSHRSGRNPSSSSNQDSWWEVVEIVEEDRDKKRYRVRWAGKDPKTGKPWPLDWVPNSHCSPDLIKYWEKKKAKKLVSSASTPAPPMTLVAFKRPSDKRDVASTSETPAHPNLKRKHPTPSGSPDNLTKHLFPRQVPVVANYRTREPTASAQALPNREDREASPSHPPLEEIEMWVPTENAKFGPPKRRRTTGKRRDPPKEGPVVADSAKTSVQASIPPPSPARPSILSESQIVALREEEEETQSQPTSNQPGEPVDDSTTGGPLQPTTKDTKGAPNVSLEGPIGRRSVDIQPINPKNVKTGHVSGPTSQGIHLQSNITNTSTQGDAIIEAPKGSSPLPAAPHISLVNFNPSANAISSSKSPQVEKHAKPSPPQIGKPGASSIKQHSPSGSGPPLSGKGMLAERRAFEARVRLDELRRAGATFGSLAKGHTALKTSQGSKQPSPHVVLKQFIDSTESPSQSQITHPANSGNEILGSAFPSENRRTDLMDESQEDLVINKSAKDANVGSLPRKGDVLATNVTVLSSEDEVPPTVSNSTQSQPHDALPHETLGSQLAAALDLLHKKSEEISELRAQVVMLRMRSTDGEAELHKQVGNGALKSMQEIDYLATGVQTDRDDEARAAWNLERTRLAKEKLALQGEAESLRGEKARVLADVDFFREQYQRASAFASSTRSENEELSARAALAESQSVNGVALVRATLEARVAKLEAEVQKYKALSEMLTERARRTDDNVRYRAARALELERDYTKLSGQFRETEAELEETWDELRAKKRVNIKLRRRIASLEAKEGAADVGQSGEQKRILSSEQKDDDDDYRPSRSPSSSPVTVGSPPQRHSPHDEDGAGPADRSIEQPASIGPDESAQSSKDDMVYLCRWRPGESAGDCDVVVSSKQELHKHVLSHHLACHRTTTPKS